MNIDRRNQQVEREEREDHCVEREDRDRLEEALFQCTECTERLKEAQFQP